MTAKTDRILGRISALLLFGLALSFGLARTGTTVMHTGPTANQCGPVKQPVRAGGSGGGLIRVGP